MALLPGVEQPGDFDCRYVLGGRVGGGDEKLSVSDEERGVSGPWDDWRLLAGTKTIL